MRSSGWVGLLAVGVACTSGRSPDGDGDGNGDGDSSEVVPSLPDPRNEVGEALSQCDGIDDSNGNFTPVAGATSYFVGEYAFDGDEVSGREVWILYANDEWVENGGGDCEIVWDIAGTKGEPLGCSTCDYGLELHGDPIESQSTCVQGLYDYEGIPFDVAYDIRGLTGEDVEVLFGSSGNLLATGQDDDEGLVWTTDGDCRFF